jgi:hypothetical protein
MTFSLPECVECGTKVADINTAHDEAQDFLDDEEWDYEWRRCTVPLHLIVSGDLEATALYGETEAEGMARFQRVRDWFAECGGAEEALEQSPVLLICDSQGIVCLDGWHRLVVAHEQGLWDIPAFVGISTTPISAFRDGGPYMGISERSDITPPSLKR